MRNTTLLLFLFVSFITTAQINDDQTKDDQINDVQVKKAKLEVVITSASRAPERLFDSPVSIELYDTNDIKNTSSVDFLGGLQNVTGVSVITSGLTYKSVNTRGFNSFLNSRFVQLVDGIDNASPSLNIALGNFVGLNELDVKSIELLPGASSALYGANAYNGILFMTSKNPFDDQGISAYVKSGVTSQKEFGSNQFRDIGIRVAHAFSDKFAAKVNFSIMDGSNWTLTEFDDDNIGERTSYDIADVTDYHEEVSKFDAALHYKPFANDLEIILNSKIVNVNSVALLDTPVAFKGYSYKSHKLEIKNDNFFIRGYLNHEDFGNSSNIENTRSALNDSWKSNEDWAGEYNQAFIAAATAGQSDTEADNIARTIANTGRLLPGTPEFQQALNNVNSDVSKAKLQNDSQFKHVDGNYNFSHLTQSFFDLQVGGSFREYKLNSGGTIFSDVDSPISYSEFGAYTQIQKKLLDNRLKITGSLRYDKSQLFDSNFSPRFSLGYTAGARKNHNIRISYQTGFRNPSNTNLYSALPIERGVFAGSSRENLGFSTTFPLNVGGTAAITIQDAYENSYTSSSLDDASQTGDLGLLKQATIDIVKPETVTTYELGYRSKIYNINIEATGYYSQYQDFINTSEVLVPLYGSVADGSGLVAIAQGDARFYILSTNSEVDINSFGATFAAQTKILYNFDLGINYTYASESFDRDEDPNFVSGFNTPKHKAVVSFGNEKLFKNFGFNTHFRWNDAFIWNVRQVSAYSVFDAQINYTIPYLKTTLKAGGNNIGGDDYLTGFGSNIIGSVYYIGFTINNL